MGAYAGSILTMADAAKRRDPSGRVAAIIEILSMTNEIINDFPAVEANNGTTHVTTIRDSIPHTDHRMINQGASEVKSGVRQIVEDTCLREGWSPVDKKLLDLCSGITEQRAHLAGEATAILEGMSQDFCDDIFYGDMGQDPAGIDGLSKRYNTTNAANPISRQVIDAGGTGANLTSIWLIQMGDTATSLIYPKGTTAGIEMKMFPDQVLRDSDGKPFEGVLSKFSWNYGLCVRDYRRIVRIANIDAAKINDMILNGLPTSADFALQRQLDYAVSLLPSITPNTYFYMGRIPYAMRMIMGGEKGNVNLTFNSPTGSPQSFGTLPIQGIPVHRCDGILVGEDQVTAA